MTRERAIVSTLLLLILLTLLACGPAASASDVDELTTMLNEFLAGASINDAAAHDRFWSEDLVYTSSRGTRTSKAEIMQGLSDPGEGDDPGPSVIYSAEDVQVDVYGTTAVVAFRLVGTPQGEAADAGVAQYFNTGTFLKRAGLWQVVAWQATQIPDPEPGQ